VLLCWSGLAWTQSTPQNPVNGVQRFMVVHENGKSTRCRVMETWKLADGRLAHKLEVVETGEFMTIVDEVAPNAEQAALLQKNPRAMAKRIIPWGFGRQTPPEGTPIPQSLRVDSGIVVRNETPAPYDARIEKGPEIVNQVIDDKAVGPRFGIHNESSQPIDFKPSQGVEGQGVQLAAQVGNPPAQPGAIPNVINNQEIPATDPPAPTGNGPRIANQSPSVPSEPIPAQTESARGGPFEQPIPTPVPVQNNPPTLPPNYGTEVPVQSVQRPVETPIANVPFGQVGRTNTMAVPANPVLSSDQGVPNPPVTPPSYVQSAPVQYVPTNPAPSVPAESLPFGRTGRDIPRTAGNTGAVNPPNTLPNFESGTPSQPAPAPANPVPPATVGMPFGQPDRGNPPVVINGNPTMLPNYVAGTPTQPAPANSIPAAPTQDLPFGQVGRESAPVASVVNPPTFGKPNPPPPSLRTGLLGINNPPGAPPSYAQANTLPAQVPPTTLPVQGPPTSLPVQTPPTSLPVQAPPATLPVQAPPASLPVQAPPTSLPGIIANGQAPVMPPNPPMTSTPAIGPPPTMLPTYTPTGSVQVAQVGSNPPAVLRDPPLFGSPYSPPPASSLIGSSAPAVLPASPPMMPPNPPLTGNPPTALPNAVQGAQSTQPDPFSSRMNVAQGPATGGPVSPTYSTFAPNTPANSQQSPPLAGIAAQAGCACNNGCGPTPPNANPDAAKPWHFGDRFKSLFQSKPAPVTAKVEGPLPGDKNTQAMEKYLPVENQNMQKQLDQKVEKIYKQPYSTAMAPPPATTPVTSQNPLGPPGQIGQSSTPQEKVIDLGEIKKDPVGLLPPTLPDPVTPKREMWGTASSSGVLPPGQSTLLTAVNQSDIAKLPPAPVRKVDPMTMPENFTPNDPRLQAKEKPPEPRKADKGTLAAANSTPQATRPAPAADDGKYPPGAQMVLAAKNGMPGPVIYVPVPTVTTPLPRDPPMPPPANVPEAPQLNAFVNAFSPPPSPRGMPQNGTMMPMGYGSMYPQPWMTPTQLYQQQMMALMYQQQFMQQQAMMNPAAQGMPYGYGNGYAMPAQGPMGARSYMGPQAPNPFASNPWAQGGYMPASYQQPAAPAQYNVATQVEQTIRALRESPYPAQREAAAHALVSFDWRTNPQIVPVLLQSAQNDPTPSVRAGCVYCLGRMQAAVEPVFATLQRLRHDTDPRVKREAETALQRLGYPTQTAQR
jgi:hypothetical protein